MEGKGRDGHSATTTMSGWICASEDISRGPITAPVLTAAHDTRRPSKKEQNSQGKRGMSLSSVGGEAAPSGGAKGFLMPILCQVSE